MVTPVYSSSGQVIGIEDEQRGISRTPTPQEKQQYAISSTNTSSAALPVPKPTYPSFVQQPSGGGGHRNIVELPPNTPIATSSTGGVVVFNPQQQKQAPVQTTAITPTYSYVGEKPDILPKQVTNPTGAEQFLTSIGNTFAKVPILGRIVKGKREAYGRIESAEEYVKGFSPIEKQKRELEQQRRALTVEQIEYQNKASLHQAERDVHSKEVTDTNIKVAESNMRHQELNDKITAFNEKYGTKELMPEDFEKATREKAQLDAEQAKLNQDDAILTQKIQNNQFREGEILAKEHGITTEYERLKAREDLINQRKEEIKKTEGKTVYGGAKAAAAQAVTTPFLLGKAVVSPTRVIREQVEAMGQMPQQFKEAPAMVIGGLVGGAAVGYTLGKAGGRIFKAEDVQKVTKIREPTVATIGKGSTESYKIGKLATGEDIFLTKDINVIEIRKATTGELVRRANTGSLSISTAKLGEAGVVSGDVTGVTLLTKQGSAVRGVLPVPKELSITQKAYAAGAEGKYNLAYGEEGIFSGTASSDVTGMGSVSAKVSESGVVIKTTKPRIPKKYTSQSNIKGRITAETEAAIEGEGITQTGRLTQAEADILTDIYGKSGPVKGHVRGGKKISPYERAVPQTNIKARSYIRKKSATFEPKETGIDLDRYDVTGEGGLRANIQEIATTTRTGAAAQAAAQSQAQAVAKVLGEEMAQPVITKKVTTIKGQVSETATRTGNVAGFLTGLEETGKNINVPIMQPITDTATKEILLGKTSTDSILKLRQKEVQAQSTTQRQRQQQRQMQEQIQLQEQMQVAPLISTQVSSPVLDITGFKIPSTFGGGFMGGGGKEGGSGRSILSLPRKRKGRKPRYTPSFGEAIADISPVSISQSEFDKLNKEVFTGLELRPLISIKRRSKKRKS